MSGKLAQPRTWGAERKEPMGRCLYWGSGCKGISLVCLNVAQSQGKVGGSFMAVATLITLVHLTAWVWWSQPACGGVQAAMENDILKHIMQQNWEVELFYWWALLSVSCSIQGKHVIIGALILFSFVK